MSENGSFSPSIVALFGSRAIYGAERANIDVLSKMQDAGARVTCLVREEDWPENHALRKRLDENGLGWRTSPWPSYPARGWALKVLGKAPRVIPKANARLRSVCDEVEATHIHLFSPFNGLGFWPALKSRSRRVIYNCGDFPTAHNPVYRLAWRLLAARIDSASTPSVFVRDMLVEQGVAEKKISVIPAPPPQRKISKPFEAPSSLGKGPRFAYMGQIASHKGVSVLLEAFGIVRGRYPEASLMIAGPLNNTWAQQLVDNAGDAADTGVFFLGAVEDIPGMLQASDIHVAPPLRPEPYGLVAVEAKAEGLPSIVFEGGGLSELVTSHSDGIIVSKRNAEALAEAMLLYAGDPQGAKADGARALVSLTEKFLVHEFSSRWQRVYS